MCLVCSVSFVTRVFSQQCEWLAGNLLRLWVFGVSDNVGVDCIIIMLMRRIDTYTSQHTALQYHCGTVGRRCCELTLADKLDIIWSWLNGCVKCCWLLNSCQILLKSCACYCLRFYVKFCVLDVLLFGWTSLYFKRFVIHRQPHASTCMLWPTVKYT